MRGRILSALLLVVCGAGLVSAQSRDHLMELRVTGTLLPREEAHREDIFTVPIVVQDTPLLWRIGQVEELTSSERAQVRDAVLLRQVRFSGPAALLQRLQQPELRGRVLTIEGLLEPQSRLFLVTAIKEAPSATPPRGK
ncbi:MAG: hypothetical protein AB7G75_04295 [Candidatus Binatia bacterium]